MALIFFALHKKNKNIEGVLYVHVHTRYAMADRDPAAVLARLVSEARSPEPVAALDDTSCLCGDHYYEDNLQRTCAVCGNVEFLQPTVRGDGDEDSFVVSSFEGPRVRPPNRRMQLYVIKSVDASLKRFYRVTSLLVHVHSAADSLDIEPDIRREACAIVTRLCDSDIGFRLGYSMMPGIYHAAFSNTGRSRTLSELSDMFGVTERAMERKSSRVQPYVESRVPSALDNMRGFITRAATELSVPPATVTRAHAVAAGVWQKNEAPRFVTPVLSLGALSAAMKDDGVDVGQVYEYARAIGYSPGSVKRAMRKCLQELRS